MDQQIIEKQGYCNALADANLKVGRGLTTKTDPGSAIKRQVLPTRPQRLPALGLELVRIGSVEVRSPLHDVRGEANLGALWNEEGCFAVYAASEWEHRVAVGASRVARNDWVQT